jgi:signal peptidase II
MNPSRLAAFGVTAAAVLAIAQAVSYLVQSRLPLHETLVVNSVVHFTHIRNTGGVFGLFRDNSLAVAVTSTLIIFAITAYVLMSSGLALWQYACAGLVVGAAAANICDRLVYGAVIDFIDIQGIPYWHYVFNVADVAIHLGAWPLAIASLIPGSDNQRGSRLITGAAPSRR